LGLTADGIIGPKTAEAMMKALGIKTKVEFALFLGQVKHESGNFSYARENLNYSADGLVKTWSTRFRHILPGESKTINQGRDGKAIAEYYARQPEKIANRVYANRMGNGDEASGDGWKYRGAGALQLTGKDNFLAYFKWSGLPPETDPNILEKPEHYFKSAKWFFDVNNVWRNCGKASERCCLAVSRHVNCGSPNAAKMPINFQERWAETFKIATGIGA
jgi:putative chitinase